MYITEILIVLLSTIGFTVLHVRKKNSKNMSFVFASLIGLLVGIAGQVLLRNTTFAFLAENKALCYVAIIIPILIIAFLYRYHPTFHAKLDSLILRK